MKQLLALLLVLLTAICCSAKRTSSCEEHFQLENSLSVILRPVSGAKSIAIVTIYSIGEDHDPKGRSGMGHLIEHLYVTAAAGQTESRNIQAFMSQYPEGWNAQTGKNYTMIATVFHKDRLESELKDAAARMGMLYIKDSDLKREIPRIQNELLNMYSGFPALAAQNLASDRVVAHRKNTRKGGIIDQIKSIDIEQIRKRLKAFYKPNNATIIIVGAINPEQVKNTINKTFSGIEKGQEMEAVPLLPKFSSTMTVNEQVVPRIPQARPYVSLAFRTPDPADRLFHAFLILVARLQVNSDKLNPPQGVFPVGFALLDRPEVVTVHLPVPEEKVRAEAVVDKLKDYVAATISDKFQKKDITNTKQVFGYMLGLLEYPDRIHADNIYGAAFALGMRKHLGIESSELIKKIDSVSQNEITEAAWEYFAPGRYATAVVNVK
ncbi:MAG: insulinase family protein [Methanosarcinaceae archaeon]|nr:insulinase family protein [Methanosarcinaceae archaeon]